MSQTTQPLCPRCNERPKIRSVGYCRPCRNAYRRQYYRDNHERAKRQVRVDAWKRQGIELSWDEYEQLLVHQDGRCAICDDPPGQRSLHVDHDHTTGTVRALLCSNCNVAIGAARDNIDLLHKMADYLTSHTVQNQPRGSVLP